MDADSGIHSYRLGINQFADMTSEEFIQTMNGLKPGLAPQTDLNVVITGTNTGLPSAVDWRNKSVVTPVKDQKEVILMNHF